MKSFSELETVAIDSNRGEIDHRLRTSSNNAPLTGRLNHLFVNEDTQDERNQIRESCFYPSRGKESREMERSEKIKQWEETIEELKEQLSKSKTDHHQIQSQMEAQKKIVD